MRKRREKKIRRLGELLQAQPGRSGGRVVCLVALLAIVLSLTWPLAGQAPCDTPAMARDDHATVAAGETVVIDILANDSDAGGEPLTLDGLLTIGNCAALGTASYNADGTIRFDAAAGAEGSCSLGYNLIGGGSASVVVSVNAGNGGGSTLDCGAQECFGFPNDEPTTACKNGTGSGHECCWRELLRGAAGLPVSTDVTEHWANAPASLFGGGSENQAVLCQAAEYVATGANAWYHDYLDAQQGFDPAQDLYGWMGTEVLSPLYGQWIVTANMVALDKARETGQTSLVNKLEDWLLTHWVMQALMAFDDPMTLNVTEMQGGPYSFAPQPSFWDGLSVATAGARRVGNELVDVDGNLVPIATLGGHTQPAHFLTALALDAHPRNFGSTNLALNSAGSPELYYASLRVPLLLEGTDFFADQDGTVDFENFEPPASVFGLTESERQTLLSFVESRGGQDPSTILGLLPVDPTPHCASGTATRCCEMTFLRTTEGTISYFGAGQHGLQTATNPGGKQYICNRNKPPHHAVRMDLDGTATFLTPGFSGNSNTPHTDNTYEQGQQVCAQTSETSTDLCITKPGGEVIYEVTWTVADGLFVREYNPQDDPPEAPTISSQPASLGVNEGEAASFQIQAQSVPPGRALDYRWSKNGVDLPIGDPRFLGVATNSLTIPATETGDAGQYRCRVSDQLEPTLFTDSQAATLTVTPTAPTLAILSQPAPQNTNEGQNATFAVTAQGPNGAGQLRYRWQRNGVNLHEGTGNPFTGVSNPTLTVADTHNSLEGDFRCVVWDAADPSTTVTSTAAALSVFEPRAPFGGSPQPIPGTLQVEHYDEGEPGIVYSDSTQEDLGANQGNWEVRRDPVDFLTGAGQAQVRLAYIAAGEFLKYTTNVSTAGPFELVMNYRMEEGPGQIQITLGGETATLDLDPQGNFLQVDLGEHFSTVTTGAQELTLSFLQSTATTAGLQINWLRFDAPEPPLPNPPIANDDPGATASPPHLQVLKDEDLVIDPCVTLLANDLGFGDLMACGTGSLRVAVDEIFQPAEGEVLVTANQLIYRPSPGYSGPDAFQYTVRDSAGQVSAAATVQIYVAADQPVALDDEFFSLTQTPEGDRILKIYKGTLINNDVAAHGQPLFDALANVPAGVDIVDPGVGTAYLIYTPPASVGTQTFQYTIRDSYVLGNGLPSEPATVTIHVTDVALQPVANPDVFFISQTRSDIQTGINPPLIALTDNDQGSGDFNVIFPADFNPGGGPPPHTGTFQAHILGFTFRPAVGFTGEAVFPYQVDDRIWLAQSDPADVTIHVVPFPVAHPDSGFVTAQDTAIEISAAALFANDDHHGRPLTALLDGSVSPSNGTVVATADGFLYTPDPGATGTDSFAYKVIDDLHSDVPNDIHFGGKADRTSAPTTVTIDILPPAPTAVDDHYLVPSDAPALLVHWNDLIADDSPTGEVEVVEVYSAEYGSTEQFESAPGTPDGTLYVPGAGLWQSGGDSFDYRIQRTDQTPPDTDLGTVHLTPLQVVDPWIADGFESGVLDAWTNTSTVGGTLDVVSKAALSGDFGLEVNIDPGATGVDPGNVLLALHQNFDVPQSHLWMDFQVELDPGLLQMGAGESFLLANTYLAGEGHLELKVRPKAAPASGFELRAIAYQDADAATSSVKTAWVDLGSEARWITVEWRASSAPGADNGELRLWRDRRLMDEKTGLDNDRKAISKVRLGAVAGLDAGTSGSVFYDDIVLWPGIDNREFLIRDDFESPLPGHWHNVIVTGGTVQTTTDAAQTGSYGMEVDIDPLGTGISAPSARLYVQERFDEPQNHLFTEFRLQIDPATFEMKDGQNFNLLTSFYSIESHLKIVMRKSAGQYQIQATAYQDPGAAPGTVTTPWVTLDTAPHWVTLEWMAASIPGANDGVLKLWIDHQSVAELTNIDNDQKTISQLRLGAVSKMDDGTQGRLFFDDVGFWRGDRSRDGYFADHFETGQLSAWSATTGSVAATAAAQIFGGYGLQVDVTGADSVATVTDTTPNDAETYQARFLIDTAGLTVGSSDRFVAMQAKTANGLTVFELKIDGGGGAPRLRLIASGTTAAATPWMSLDPGLHEVRLSWQATEAGGTAQLWIDDAFSSLSTYDSGGRTIDAIELGAVRAVDAGTVGVIAIDDFRSWR